MAVGVPLLLWRWFSGEAWHGRPITDAGWRRPGRRALTVTGHAGRFWHLPRWRRAFIRTSGTFLGLVIAWGMLENWLVTAVVFVLSVCAWFGRHRIRRRLAPRTLAAAGQLVMRPAAALTARRQHQRSWLLPLHMAAHEVAQIPRATRANSWISIDRDRTKVVLSLPPGWPADDKDKQRLVAITTAKTGLEDPDVSWRLAGPEPRLTLTRGVPPPQRVSLDDVREAIEQARSHELVLGMGKRGRIVKASLAGDSPHLGLSMGSGAGKSVLARNIMAQVAWRGGILLVLDPKLISHQWARGLPNAAYAGTPPQMHASLLWLGREIARRSQVALTAADIEGEVRANVGPRLLVVCEEMNAAMARLRSYWREIREREDATRSPAVEALEDGLFMGRQLRVNFLMIGQMLSAKASGSGEARENMGIRILGRYSQNNWKMLVPEHPMPPKSMLPGRIQVVTSGVSECQVPFLTGAQAQELALSGQVTPTPAGMPGSTAVPAATRTEIPGPDLPVVPETRPRVLVPSGRVTLSEAVALNVVTCSLAAIRKASQRDPEFPGRQGLRGLAGEYDAAELATWDAGRS